MEGKKCWNCKEIKYYKDFYKNKSKKDGYSAACKECTRKEVQKYRKNNPEKIKRSVKKYIQKNKETKKKYYKENSDRSKELRKKRYEEHKEREKEKMKEYRNSEKGRESKFKSYLKRRSCKQKVSFSSVQRKRLLDRDNWTCQSCGIKVHDKHTGNWNTPDKAHIDHIIPLTKGGNSESSNLQVLCRTCNISKKDKINKQLEFVF